MTKIAPSVLLANGETMTPEGWMWVLAFALRGVPWALRDTETPAFTAAVESWRRRVLLANCDNEEAEIRANMAALEHAMKLIQVRRESLGKSV